MTDQPEKPRSPVGTVRRGEIIHPERDLRLDTPGAITLLDRITLYRREVLFKAQAAVARAFADFQRATKDASTAQRELEEELIHNQEWDGDVVRRRYAAQYREEDARLEHDVRLADLERQEELEAKEYALELARASRAAARTAAAREEAPTDRVKPSAEDLFRAEAEQIMKHGFSGKFMGIAAEFREQLIKERGGEENLTDEDRERIEQVFALARRKQESKS